MSVCFNKYIDMTTSLDSNPDVEHNSEGEAGQHEASGVQTVTTAFLWLINEGGVHVTFFFFAFSTLFMGGKKQNFKFSMINFTPVVDCHYGCG